MAGVAYTINGYQPVRCTYISDRPVFYDTVTPAEEAELPEPVEARYEMEDMIASYGQVLNLLNGDRTRANRAVARAEDLGDGLYHFKERHCSAVEEVET